MRAASRLIPIALQSARASAPRLCIPFPPTAGPSRLPSSFSRLATTSSIPSTNASQYSGQSIVEEDESLPSNLTFEGFEDEARGEVGRGLALNGTRLHANPSVTLGPIILPLSSLASPTPTLAAPSNLAIALPRDVFAQPLRRDILHRCVVWYLSTLRQGNQSTKSRSTVAYSGRKLRKQKGTGKARVGDASSGIRRGGAPIFALHPRDHAQLLPRKIRLLGLKIALSSKLSSGLLRVVADLGEGQWKGTAEARRALSDQKVDAHEVLRLSKQLGLVDLDETSIPEASVSSTSTDTQIASPVEETIDSEPTQLESLQILQKFGHPSSLSILFLHSPGKPLAEVEKLDRAVRNIPGVLVMSTVEVEVWHLLKYKWVIMDGEAVDSFGVEVDFSDEVLGDSEYSQGEEVAL